MRVKIFVNSPFQVIGAWEFMEALPGFVRGSTPVFDLALLDAGTDTSVRQTRDTAARLGIPCRAIGSGARGVAGARELFRLMRAELGELASDDLVAVGDPCFDLYQDLLARTPTEIAWVLDDGVGNWRSLRAVVEGDPLPGPLRPGFARGVAKRLVLGELRVPPRDRLRWFTLFARYLGEHEHVVQNRFTRLKAKSRLTAPSERVLFLGSPLVAAGIQSTSDYTAFCRQAAGTLAGRYPGAALTYLRHRREGPGEAAGAAHFPAVEDSMGPVELRWLGGSSPPRAVAGAFSTALFTLAELLRGTSDIICLWPGGGFEFMARRAQLNQLLPLFEIGHSEGSIELVMIGRSCI
ncbi:MAG: hypothetical protein ACR2GQ_04985 [Gemmatimonadota bacterium]